MADLDRLLTLTVRGAPVRDEFNQFQPGPVSFDGKVWCRQQDVGSGQEVSGGILATVFYRTFTIRHRADLVGILNSQIDLVDEDGSGWSITRVAESDERKRFMELETQRTA